MSETQQQPISNQEISQTSNELLQETLQVQTKAQGLLGNFMTVATNKANEMVLSIIGDYGYKPKNEFNYTQKHKILEYLKAKVYTVSAQINQQEKGKFIDYDPDFLNTLPDDIQDLRNKILKSRSYIESAQKTLQNTQFYKKRVIAEYLNEQAFEFDKVKKTSIAWGFLFGAFLNVTLYKHGSPVRRAALFLTCGHLFGQISYSANLDRYFDAVYPIFQKDAVEYSAQEEVENRERKPVGQGIMEE